MLHVRPTLVLWATAVLVVSGCTDQPDPATVDEGAARRALLAAAMSDGSEDVPPPGYPPVPKDALSRWDFPYWRLSDEELASRVREADGHVSIGLKEPGTRRGMDRYGRILVTSPTLEAAKEALRGMGVRIDREYSDSPIIEATIPPSLVAALRAHPMVDYIEAQRPIQDLGQSTPWNVSHVRAPQTWPYSTGTGVKLLVIDSKGVQSNHPDMNVVIPHRCAVSNTPDGSHGTQVAGVAAALNNSRDVVGVAHGVTLWGMRVEDRQDVACAVNWSRLNGVDVINMSFQVDSTLAIFEELRRAYYWNNVYLVAAAGDLNRFPTVTFPARMYEVVAVGAVDQNNNRASNSPAHNEIELAAPGVNVKTVCRYGGICTASGTSYAAPHVAAAGALLRAKYGWDVVTIRNRLNATATDLGNHYASGNGLLNVEKALKPGVTVSGPNQITTPGTYEWTANPSGGSGSYTYRWSVYWYDSGLTVQLGTGKRESLHIDASDGDFRMQVRVTSAGVPGYAPGTKFVFNRSCGETFC